MSEFKIVELLEQKVTFDDKFKLPIDSYLLMKIINHMSAETDKDLEEMENPKEYIVRVTIETKKL